MSQSFEKKVGSRLQHYEPEPPPHLKSKVFEAVTPSRGLNGWQVTGLILFIVSWLFWIGERTPGTSHSIALAEKANESNKIGARKSEKISELPSPQKDKKEIFTEVKKTTSVDLVEKNGRVQPSKSVRAQTGQGDAMAFQQHSYDQWPTWSIAGKDANFYQFPTVGNIFPIHFDSKSEVLSKVIKPPKKAVPFYLESGLFFLYQQAMPNLQDQLVIESFEGAGGLSPKGLGVYFEAGMYHVINPKLRVHLGIKANTYRQSYAFTLRNFGADDVVLDQTGDEIIFQPVYDQDKIQVDHRLYSAGGMMTLNWSVFPSYTNELVTSIEYLTVLNPNQSFQYDNRTYSVGYADQWLISIGLRKSLMEGEKGLLQIHPTIRYSLSQAKPVDAEVLSLKPYSVGVSFSYLFGNFRERYKK